MSFEKEKTIVFISAQYLEKLSFVEEHLGDSFIVKRVDTDIEAGVVNKNGINKISKLLDNYPKSKFLMLCGGEAVPYSNALTSLNVDKKRILSCGEIPFNFNLGKNKFLVFQDYFRKSSKISGSKKLAYAALNEISQILENNNIAWTVFFGTLLGLVRESDLMDHDDDIDFVIIGMKIEEFSETLSKFNQNFKIIKLEENIISFVYKNSSFNIDFYFTNTFNKDNLITFGGYDFEERIISLLNETKNNKLIRFAFDYPEKLCHIRIPDNPLPFLEYLYGEKWTIPIKNLKTIPIRNLKK